MMHESDVPRFIPRTAIITEEGEYMEYDRTACPWATKNRKCEDRKIIGWLIWIVACIVIFSTVGWKVANAGEVYVGKSMSGKVVICDTLDEAMLLFNATIKDFQGGVRVLRALFNQQNAEGKPRCGNYDGPLMFVNLMVSRTTTLPNGQETPVHVATVTTPVGYFYAVPIRVTFGEGSPVETST